MAQQLKPDIDSSEAHEKRVRELLGRMTLAEKIGQLSLINTVNGDTAVRMRTVISEGRIGAILNEVNRDVVNELQHIAIKESRLGIPLLVGRDVIHGFNTIFPIPLGLAATWNPQAAARCGRVSAIEASACGVNWTFAPVVDIARDPRWGRVAESFGEDPHLSSKMTRAIIQGLQGDNLSGNDSVGACAKHFAGYGACESGKDYNTTNIPRNELRNVHLPPFKTAVEAGVMSLMTAFSDIDGIPASANEFLIKQILRQEWGFTGFVVSDWESIGQMIVHGFTDNDKDSAFEAANAGVDMEMTSQTYANNLEELLEEGRISIDQINTMTANVLRAKFRLGLFERTLTETDKSQVTVAGTNFLNDAKQAAQESCVLLENKDRTLPLDRDKIKSVAVIGPLADDPYEQLGTWVFDGDVELSQTPLRSIEALVGERIKVNYARAMDTSRSKGHERFDEALKAAKESDVVILFLGEESILTGEAHCRADISLPGCQEELIEEIHELGKPTVLVLMTGRPLLLEQVRDKVDAILYAWHAGSMAGPAIADLLFGEASPSGKLPVTFPRVNGQIPIYYAHKNTCRPGTPDTIVHMDDIKVGAQQHSFGNTSFYLDIENSPLYPFGYGLSYGKFEYADLRLSEDQMKLGGSIKAMVDLTNVGPREAEEVVQLYVRDLVGSVTRPVKELKGFQRVRLQPNETRTVTFELRSEDLAFYNREMLFVTEPGRFHLWIGGSSEADLVTDFEVVD